MDTIVGSNNFFYFASSGFKQLLLVVLVLGMQPKCVAQYEVPVPQNSYNRAKISLNGHWNYFVDRYEAFYYDFVRVPFDSSNLGKKDFAALDGIAKNKSDRFEYGFDYADSLRVPGDWNSQKEKLFYYEGSIWYRKRFDKPKITENQKAILHFGAVNYITDVYLNGKKVGYHEGGFTPFAFDISNLLIEGSNSLVLRVDNKRHRDAVPTDVTDWWNYGGITRDVSLLILPKNYIEDYSIQLSPSNGRMLKGYVQLSSQETGVTIRIQNADLNIDENLITTTNGKIDFSIELPKSVVYWSPDTPKLYEFKLTTKEDTLQDLIGLRTITTKGDKIFLNGESIFLRGICAHEENPIEGRRNYSKEDALQLFNWAKELNANYMRLAHYPHNEHMPRVADSLGILLWEEIPVYWTIDWKNQKTYKNAKKQLADLVSRDKNRASVIIWSLANETPDIPERLVFLKSLAKKTKALDSTRLISAALFKEKLEDNLYTITDPFSEYTDLVSFNQYLGWYEGLPASIDSKNFVFNSNKPVIVSEFGAGAKAGFHANIETRWSEEFQNHLYEETLELLNRMPNLAGFSPWILADFRSPRRQLPHIQDGWNRKGIIGQNGEKKKAFYTLREYYINKGKE